MAAKIVEIFHSLQGEGIFVGQETTFIRFLGCNLFCSYCDTLYARDEKKAQTMDLEKVVSIVSRLAKPGEFVSLTGGEPLLWSDFLAGLCPRLRDSGWRIYLETNGTLVREMERLKDAVDMVAMDIKPPSDCGQDLWGTHQEFLRLVAGRAFVKLVVTQSLQDPEVEKAVDVIARVDPKIPLVLQPASGELAPEMGRVRRYRAEAGQRLADVRIVLQMHKQWGLR